MRGYGSYVVTGLVHGRANENGYRVVEWATNIYRPKFPNDVRTAGKAVPAGVRGENCDAVQRPGGGRRMQHRVGRPVRRPARADGVRDAAGGDGVRPTRRQFGGGNGRGRGPGQDVHVRDAGRGRLPGRVRFTAAGVRGRPAVPAAWRQHVARPRGTGVRPGGRGAGRHRLSRRRVRADRAADGLVRGRPDRGRVDGADAGLGRGPGDGRRHPTAAPDAGRLLSGRLVASAVAAGAAADPDALLSPGAGARVPGRIRPDAAAAATAATAYVPPAVFQMLLRRHVVDTPADILDQQRLRNAPAIYEPVLRNRRPEDRPARSQEKLRNVRCPAADRVRSRSVRIPGNERRPRDARPHLGLVERQDVGGRVNARAIFT